MRVKGTLTPRQKKMVDEYIICGVKRQAAIRAGFQVNYAEGAFKQPSVQKYLAERKAEIQEEAPEIDRLAQENAELRDQVYNLTLYLLEALWRLDELDKIVNDEDDGRFTAAFNIDFDGMPGYNPAILEARHGKTD